MAEGENEQTQGWGGGGGWLTGWIAAAKEQTEKVFDVVSTDLAEFTTTMQKDTKSAVEKTKETLQQTSDKENKSTSDMMKQSFHNLMTGITKVLTVDPDDDVPVKKKSPTDTTGLFDRAKARLRAIQVDTGTYLNEPSGPSEKYADWLKSFDMESRKGEISDLLVTMVEVRSLYTSLVPSEVSHQDFWRRYFYKLYQLDVDEARKQALMKRAERANVKEDSVGWDEEEWSGDDSPEPSPQKHKDSTVKTDEETKDDLESRLAPDPAEAVKEKTDLKNSPEITAVSQSHADPERTTDSPSHADPEVQAHVKRKEVNISDNTEQVLDNGNKDSENTVVNDEKANSVIKEDNNEESVNTTGIDAVTELATESRVSEDKVPETSDIAETGASQQTDNNDSGKSMTNKPVSNPVDETLDVAKEPIERDLKTKVKGDMVVVGDRESPSSESSDNKESVTEDWEQDFDVEITPDDLAAASELAQKMNMSANDYNTITGGEEDDWENWD